ncbi:hypothetical protein LCGC14_0170370 [marine sediment metagenome]|jgi:hypothetical protein|uniref:Arc-like DNA binding domain-containing protein n=1 Tax=marine sediment metagenome TaxID=412755 RepID=A0A0F9XUS9_9ZZZZ|tara:strand:- start:180 stop:719 length:540 start_codon:yes stop_codon:yes gene_type:complete
MSADESKSYDRIMLRLNQTLFDSLSRLASNHHRSFNGELSAAFASWIFERDTLTLMKDRLLASAGEDIILSVHGQVQSFDLRTGTEKDSCKFPVRLREDLALSLREAYSEANEGCDDALSLNAYMKMVLSWWVSHSFQVEACSKAIYRDYKDGGFSSQPIRDSMGFRVFTLPSYAPRCA